MYSDYAVELECEARGLEREVERLTAENARLANQLANEVPCSYIELRQRTEKALAICATASTTFDGIVKFADDIIKALTEK